MRARLRLAVTERRGVICATCSPRPGTPGRGVGGEGLITEIPTRKLGADLPSILWGLCEAYAACPSPLAPLPGVPGRGGQDFAQISMCRSVNVRGSPPAQNAQHAFRFVQRLFVFSDGIRLSDDASARTALHPAVTHDKRTDQDVAV